MWDHIQHEQYRGCNIRSSPVDLRTEWKVRIDITPPNGSSTIECLDEAHRYASPGECHLAGFEYGRQIIDGWVQKPSGLS